MLALLDAGAVWPPTIIRYKLADAAEAHRVSEGRHLQGKLVLRSADPTCHFKKEERHMAGNGQMVIDLDKKRMTAMARRTSRR